MSNELPPLFRKAKLTPPALALAKPDQTMRQYLDVLLTAGLVSDAVRLLSWALGRREAVWWACQCVRRILNEKTPPGERLTLEAAERWVSAPSDEVRWGAHNAAETNGFGTPAGCAAMAAFWSSGSMAPANLPAVPPPEHLLPTSVFNAINLATVQNEPEMAEEKYRLFVSLGLDVAEGKNRWKEGPPVPLKPPATTGRQQPPTTNPRVTKG